MLTPREATEAPTQRSRSPLSPTEVTELAAVRLFLILSALLCSLRPGFCIVCDFAHARPIMLQHSTSIIGSIRRFSFEEEPGNELFRANDSVTFEPPQRKELGQMMMLAASVIAEPRDCL